MHPLQNGSQATVRPAKKPLSGTPGYFTESGDNNVPSYPGADWFNHVIDEFQNALIEAGVVFDQEEDTNLSQAIRKLRLGSFFTIDSISSLSIVPKIEGQKVFWLGYYSAFDGGSNFGIVKKGSHVDDGGSIFSLDTDTYIEANNPYTSLMWGVVSNDILSISQAVSNRKKIENMLRNQSVSRFSINNKGNVHILGSIHPVRSDIEIFHEKGCNIKGYLDDPSHPEVESAGHIFGFALYQDPDNRDFTITGPTENLIYHLNGDIASIYRSVHTNEHNNNCIGFADALGCYVVGSGGVSESDHKGIVFDFNAIDCHIDIGYINQTSNEPCQIKGNPLAKECTCTIHIGRVENPRFDGGNAPVVCFLQEVELGIVSVGRYFGSKSDNPQLVGAFGCGKVILKDGYCENCSQLLRQYDTREGVVYGIQFKNVDSIVRRGGVTPDAHHSTRVIDNACLGGGLNEVYRSEYNGSRFKVLEISNNNLENAAGIVNLYNPTPISSSGSPYVFDVNGNSLPSGWDSVQGIPNKKAYFDTLVTSASSFQYDLFGEKNDIPYTKLDGRIVSGALTYPFQFDLLLMTRTSFNYSVAITHQDGSIMRVTSSKDPGTQLVTFTLDNAGTGSTFGEVIVHN
ncbi:hypothetical protein [Shewanella algae]|uniref:hypothetical protein n=1 Tax=Shewanella algae TaxID=38313 RepID=UPI001AAE6384|nr:hypothetical protein [Shewanella algae]MBO2589316.1 hypothetical protein [Shewanella algae]